MKSENTRSYKNHSSNFSPFGGARGGFFILKTFLHYFKANLLVALGVAVAAMILTGSLVIGDSVRYSLKQATFYRLGNTTHQVSVTERYFRTEMAAELESANPELKATPILLLEGMAVSGGGELRANKVQVVGVNNDFDKISNHSLFSELTGNEIAISENLAEKLQVAEGDNMLVRVEKASLIPMNAPFVSVEETTVSLRATVKKVVSKEELGCFSLKNSQTAPYNVFVSINRLNNLMQFEGKANRILVSAELETPTIEKAVKLCLKPADAGLSVKTTEKTGEQEVSTERVFLEDKIVRSLSELGDANPVLAYFVNAIFKKEDTLNRVPYSFAASVSDDILAENEIMLNSWAANDLKVKPGDQLILNYFEIGPLRKLMVKEAEFTLKQIVPMDSEWADPELVPHLPGLTDAGHCREWDTGVPINLDAIREKDEKYWNDFKGTPKAFVSEKTALKLWSNRYGSFTAVRFPAGSFNIEKWEKQFSEDILPSDLGMMVEPVREKGVYAAENGTDFSGLFIGLSFFILVAAILLTALLFRFNLENRTTQVGLLEAVGFQQKQIRWFFLAEGAAVSLAGAALGIVFSVAYTKVVFGILNTLWFDIVRTNVLALLFLPGTLITGFLISVFISVITIFISLKKFQKQKTADLQKGVARRKKMRYTKLGNGLLSSVFLISITVFIQQMVASQINPSLFFLSGGLLLFGFILLFRKIIEIIERNKSEFKSGRLPGINLARNKNRSVTVVILFALGTFIVVSTGSNKLDLFASAREKTSGTGGFSIFAETTVPVLFDVNSAEKRAEEGILEKFNAVQFGKLDGDDASCLNLNRIVQPAVLGVEPDNLWGRFSFAVKPENTPDSLVWDLLSRKTDEGFIPAIADQTVIQWGLGKKVGDILLYQNEIGDTLRLQLIAGTKPSVFQGYVIISNQHFLENFPGSSGSNLFLIETDFEKETRVDEELQSVFRDFGWESIPTARKLVEFYSVTNTYLSIFLAMGTLGLLLGTIGLAVILARTLLERRREIALMLALGFTVKKVFLMLVKEYLVLLFAGVLIGFITAVIATLPAFLSTNSDASLSTVAIFTGLILINGMLWITGLAWFSLQRKIIVPGLRVE